MSYFISKLKGEIKAEVKIFNPKTMMDSIALAKLVEDKASAHRWNLRPPFMKTHNIFHPSNNSSAPPPNRTMQTKKLTWDEMEEHWKKGLCYNYDEKFIFGHRYTQQMLFLLDTNSPSDEEYESAPKDAIEEPQIEETLIISYSALVGITSP